MDHGALPVVDGTTWQIGAAANAVIGLCYFAIAGTILRGLVRTRQVLSNPLALATAAIFTTCAVHHGAHAVHLLLPEFGVHEQMGLQMRAVWSSWPLVWWDVLGAIVAMVYLGLRRSYGVLLNSPAMFEDRLRSAEEAQTRAVIDRMADAVSVIGPDGVHVQTNARARAMLERLGHPLDVAIADRVWGAVAEHGAPMTEADLPVEVTRRTGRELDDVVIGVPDADGVLLWLRVTTRRMAEEPGPPHAVLASYADVTEQRRVASALAHAEVRHSTIVAELHEGVVVLDATGVVRSANPRAVQLLGLTLEQLCGEAPVDVDVRARFEDGTPCDATTNPAMVALRTGHAQLDAVVAITTAGAVTRWLLTSATPLRDGDDHVTGAVASFTDITARREAEERLRVTLDSLHEGVLFYGADGWLQDASVTALKILDGPPNLAPAREEVPMTRTLRAEDGTTLARADYPVVRASREGVAVAEVVLRTEQDGVERYVEVNAVPLRSEANPTGPWPVVESFSDVTERVGREQAVRDAEQRFRTLFTQAPIGMVLVDPDGRLVSVNAAFAEITGHDAERLVTLTIDDITYPDDLGEDLDQLARVVAGEQDGYRLEKRYVHALGHVVWVQLDTTAVRDAQGEVEFVVGMVQDISDRRRHEQQLEHLADHDALTGLLNRRGFMRELERHTEHAHRYQAEGALLMLDLDHFKYINDTLGHKAGDELIVELADLLRLRLRKTDVVARLGGDEFAVLIPRGGVAQARDIARSILQAVRDRPPIRGAEAVRMTVSIGLVPFDRSATAEEMLVSADLAMYDAKEAGRDGVSAVSDDRAERPKVAARMNWITRIRSALDEDGLRLHAQPIVDARTGEVAMHELLLRMVGPAGELVPPGTFLYVAERFDLIQDIDRWVLGQAAAMLGQARRIGRPLRLSANVSGRSLVGTDLLSHLAAELSRHDAAPEDLMLEITETSAVAHVHHARAFANGVRDLGCRLAIDDFGAGFGSFYYLKNLPFDVLKIDGEFVTGAPVSRPDQLIVEAVRDLAHGLGREVVAEFCATAGLQTWLTDHRIDYVQGYHLGRPVPALGLLAGTTANGDRA